MNISNFLDFYGKKIVNDVKDEYAADRRRKAKKEENDAKLKVVKGKIENYEQSLNNNFVHTQLFASKEVSTVKFREWLNQAMRTGKYFSNAEEILKKIIEIGKQEQAQRKNEQTRMIRLIAEAYVKLQKEAEDKDRAQAQAQLSKDAKYYDKDGRYSGYTQDGKHYNSDGRYTGYTQDGKHNNSLDTHEMANIIIPIIYILDIRKMEKRIIVMDILLEEKKTSRKGLRKNSI